MTEKKTLLALPNVCIIPNEHVFPPKLKFENQQELYKVEHYETI